MIVILKINMFINSIYKTLNFQNSHASLKKLSHVFIIIQKLTYLVKFLNILNLRIETHAGFYLGFFCWGREEVDPERIF